MIDISPKFPTARTARACATVSMLPVTIDRLERNDLPKPDALIVARWAGIQAAKRTSELIPACHQVPLDHVSIGFAVRPAAGEIEITACVKAEYKTGVEVEAMTAASVAALTLFDMLKPIDDTLEIASVKVLEKAGGIKSRDHETDGHQYRASVLVISDSAASGTRADASGRVACERLSALGFAVGEPSIVPDDPKKIAAAVERLCAEEPDLLITSGGTGLGPRDNTARAVRGLLDRDAPGIAEWLRAYGQRKTPNAILSGGIAGMRGATLVITLPGSPRAVNESLDALAPSLHHALRMIAGEGH